MRAFTLCAAAILGLIVTGSARAEDIGEWWDDIFGSGATKTEVTTREATKTARAATLHGQVIAIDRLTAGQGAPLAAQLRVRTDDGEERTIHLGDSKYAKQ